MKMANAIMVVLGVFCIAAAHADQKGTVRIDIRFIAYPKSTINETVAKDITKPLDVDVLSELLRQGTGAIISSHSIVSESNQETIIVDQDIHRIAQDVDVEISHYSTETNFPVVAIAKPQDFEDIGAGMLLKATPVISESSIMLDIEIQKTGNPEFSPRRIGCVHSEKGDLNLSIDKAVVNQLSISTRTTLRSGETTLLSSGMTHKEDEDVYVFVTCTILR